MKKILVKWIESTAFEAEIEIDEDRDLETLSDDELSEAVNQMYQTISDRKFVSELKTEDEWIEQLIWEEQ